MSWIYSNDNPFYPKDHHPRIWAWDLDTGKEKITLTENKPIRCVAFSPDSKTLATGEFDLTAKLRDPATGAVRRTLSGHTGAINSVAFTRISNRERITAR